MEIRYQIILSFQKSLTYFILWWWISLVLCGWLVEPGISDEILKYIIRVNTRKSGHETGINMQSYLDYVYCNCFFGCICVQVSKGFNRFHTFFPLSGLSFSLFLFAYSCFNSVVRFVFTKSAFPGRNCEHCYGPEQWENPKKVT